MSASLSGGSPNSQRRLAAIVFTDIVGYSARMQRDEHGTLAAVQADFARMGEVCAQHEGEVLNTMGDGLLLCFGSAVQAVACALALQAEFARRPAEALQHRIGIHLGDVFRQTSGGVAGDGVNLAARLQTKAPPGGVCVSQTVYDTVKGKVPMQARFIGPESFKNIAEPIPIWHLAAEGTEIPVVGGASAGSGTGVPFAGSGNRGQDARVTQFRAPTIPDYDLVRKIGEGGYGEVWLARGVTGAWRAVKLVWRNRFPDAEPFEREFRGVTEAMALPLREAGALALHHVGRNDAAGFFYYVMELADDAGRGADVDPARYVPLTLKEVRARRGRLPVAECVALGAELARGLAALHARGLVHRDIKPSNVVFVNGAPKLADIGLVAPSASAHTFVGTEGFVPPEGPGTPAADVYALGKVLYELATGQDRADYPKLPDAFGDAAERASFFRFNAVLLRACAPTAAQRYPDAAALVADLAALAAGRAPRRARSAPRWVLPLIGVVVLAGGLLAWRWPPSRDSAAVAPGALPAPPMSPVAPPPAPVAVAPEGKTLVVLPLQSLGADPDLGVLADGLHEDIIATVSRLADLKVISRTSALAFKGSPLSLAEIGQKTGADHALSGSVRKVGDALRIQMDLRRTRDEALLWQNTFSFASDAGLAVQERIAGEVANILQARATKGSWAGAKFMTTNEEAYRLFAKARVLHGVQQPRLPTFEEQIRLCTEALKLDPNFMQAANLLSISYSYAYRVLRGDAADGKRKHYGAEAKRWAEISSKLAPGGAGDGAFFVYYNSVERDPVRAFAYAENEVRALPNDANGHNRIGGSLQAFGRHQEALAAYERALELDPQNFRALHNWTLHLAGLRRLPEFEAAVARTLGAYGKALHPRNYAGYHFLLTGKVQDALEGLPPPLHAKLLYSDRKFDAALAILDRELGEPDVVAAQRISLLLQQAEALIAAGRRPEAAKAAEAALLLIEQLKPEPEADQSDYDRNRMWAFTYLGREAEALTAARRYVDAIAPTGAVSERLGREAELAEVYAYFGRAEECTALLAKLLRAPGFVTVPALRVVPLWDGVRADARFQALLADPKNSEPF